MSRLYINPTLENNIRKYCELNEIEDVNAFANRCAMQGFNILRYGISPKDNITREINGIKDISKDELKKKKQEPQRTEDVKLERTEVEEKRDSDKEEKVEPTEERKTNVTVRRIKVIKK